MEDLCNPAAQLLIPYNNANHEIYRKTLKDAMSDVKDIFCDEYARQTLRIHYQNYRYSKGDLRVYLVKKEELFSSMMNIFHIPDNSHNPPNSFNPLFDTFKQDFVESLKDNRMLYIEFSRVFMIIKSYAQLTVWVNNQQKTQAMLQIFDKQDSPKNNCIKTFKSITPPQQQSRFQAK